MVDILFDKNNESLEFIESSDVSLIQSLKGYRFNSDSIALTEFLISRLKKKSDPISLKLADFGAGNGIISILLAKTGMFAEIDAFEIQETLFEIMTRNIKGNKLEDTVKAKLLDYVRERLRNRSEYYDVIVCNPPYRKPGTGKVSKNREKLIARHEIKADLESTGKSINYFLKSGGSAFLVYPSFRLPEFFITCKKLHLEPEILQIVYHAPDSDSDVFAVEVVKGGGGELKIISPHYIKRSV